MPLQELVCFLSSHLFRSAPPELSGGAQFLHQVCTSITSILESSRFLLLHWEYTSEFGCLWEALAVVSLFLQSQ